MNNVTTKNALKEASIMRATLLANRQAEVHRLYQLYRPTYGRETLPLIAKQLHRTYGWVRHILKQELTHGATHR